MYRNIILPAIMVIIAAGLGFSGIYNNDTFSTRFAIVLIIISAGVFIGSRDTRRMWEVFHYGPDGNLKVGLVCCKRIQEAERRGLRLARQTFPDKHIHRIYIRVSDKNHNRFRHLMPRR